MTEVRNKQGKVSDENLREAAKLKKLWDASAEDRKAKGVGSQAAFGAEYDIGNQGAVWQYLNGKTALSLKAAMGFARGLGSRVSDFSPRLASEVQTIASAPDVVMVDRDTGRATVIEMKTRSAPDSTFVDGLAQAMSLTPFRVPSTMTWRELMKVSEVPEWFTLEMPDEALSPSAPKGSKMIFQRSNEGVPGKAALIEDRDGERYVRWFATIRGSRWLAQATGSGYVDMDSERDGLRVLAVARFRE